MSNQQGTNLNTQVMSELGIAFLTWRRYLQRHLVPLGITLKQYYVLRRLAQREFLHPSEIANMLFCDRPTATVIVRNMEKQEWVNRRKDTQDRRQVRVVITGAGHAKLSEVTQSSLWTAAESAFDPLACFDEAEVDELNRLLAKMNEHLEQIKS
jgi:DNA-binding MarR family transcriptional regulator